uniref:E3 ubiquitin/ISG15 ligase TRIM25-like isoform X2 n=1 Tax=Crassostrea virginica TaxID=6565 RepID=A0A8B8BJR9_CRAVI|nr:E3 ubiquitin/ISG15 ligase TRIM25-like isoform X2 [Crassostrea virginica]
MASSKAETLVFAKEIKNVCPICFESFKTPRYLPCFHTFCHNCLSSYILSTYKSKENPVGFPCPLCRQFVPAPSSLGEPEKWTELIPINTITQTMCEKKDQFCDACRRADEEEVATDWCKSCLDSLCRTCVKFHKRNAASQNHELIPVSEKETVPIAFESRVLCIDHNAPAKYLCVDHEELCCAECGFTKHRKCNQVDEIEKTAENLIQSGTLKNLAQEIVKHNDVLIQAKAEGETTMKHIDETSDKIAQESTDLRDKLVRHINDLVEAHLNDLAKKVKGIKAKLATFEDTVTDRQLLMTQYSQILTCVEKTPPPILVQNYLKIQRQFKQVTGLCLYKTCVDLHSEASKQLLKILDTLGLEDVRVDVKSIPIGSIDLTHADMKLICELPGSGGGYMFGGCFLENGDIVLADWNSRHCLFYSNNKLVRKLTLEGYSRDVMYRKPSELLISTNLNGRGHIAHYSHINLQKFKNITESNESIFQLAKSSEFIYAACSTFILKLDHGGNTVKQIAVDQCTYSVAVNKRQEIISSSCSTHKVTVMNQSGVKIHSYSHENLRHPYGLDVNFTGNIFVAGQLNNNIHVLTPTAELLKIFEVTSPSCIKFKENSYTCIVSAAFAGTKIYEFFPKGLEA